MAECAALPHYAALEYVDDVFFFFEPKIGCMFMVRRFVAVEILYIMEGKMTGSVVGRDPASVRRNERNIRHLEAGDRGCC